MTTRGQNLAVVVTCLVGAMTYAGAVTMDGMGMFVLPGVVGAALLGSFLAGRRMPGAALIVGGVLILGWSELVNVWSGTGAGPAARSAFVAAGCTLVAVVVARSSSPALFLLAIAASVCGALLLGAGSEVRSVAVASVVSAALTLGWIEQSRRNWTVHSRRGPALVLLSLLVGAVAAGVVLLQVQRDPRPPEATAAGQASPRIRPPWTDPLGMARKSQHELASRSTGPLTKRQTQRRHDTPPPQRVKHPTSHKPPPPHTHKVPPKPVHPKQAAASRTWIYVLAGVLLLALALAARLVAVRLAWRRLRRRLASGAPPEQVTGAWAWMRLRLEACRLPLPAAVSPDVVAAGGAAGDLPAYAFARLEFLARTTSLAAFAGEGAVAPADGTAAWKAAGQVDASARRHMTRGKRARLAFRSPAPSAGTS